MKVRFVDFTKNTEGELELVEIQAGEPELSLLHQVVKALEANERAGTRATKSRGEVKGGGRKPWPQKHTGRARHGSIRSPLWIKGGHAFALEPGRPYVKVNTRVKKKVLLSLISHKAGEGHMCLVDGLNIDVPSTSRALAIIDRLGLKGHKVVVVTSGSKESILKSFRNLEGVTIIPVEELNARHLLLNDSVAFELEAYKKLTERA